MDPIYLLLAALLALAVGLAFGWFAGRARASALAEERGKAADLLRLTLDEVTKERDAASRELAALQADARNFETRIAELKEAKDALAAQFREVGTAVLGEAQKQFLERADARFNQAGEKSEQQLKVLLQPVELSLRQHRELIDKVEAARTEAYGNLTGVIGEMKAGQEAVRSEAARLVNSLRSAPKARGRWGEQQLRNVLETCGLSDICDFQTEVSVEVEEGRLRPDVVVRVPGGKSLVIDAKVSLNAYQDAFAAVEERERGIGLDAHAAAMKAHVNSLGNKAYWSQFADAPDYVIMFVPGEHFLSAALERDPKLWDFAFDKKVLLATPTNLIAIARTVAAVWRQEKLAAEAQKIGKLGKDMYDRLAVAAGHLRSVGTGLGSAVNNYNKFVSSFESRVLVTGREFRALNIETGAREIEELASIDVLPRYGEDTAAPLIAATGDPPDE